MSKSTGTSADETAETASASTSTEPNSSDTTENESPSPTTVKIAKALIVFFLVVALLAGGTSLVLNFQNKSGAQSKLEALTSQRGEIQPKNSASAAFQGQSIEGADSSQKALVESSGALSTEQASFVFWNGKSADAAPVDIYLDFTEQRGRDYFLSNAEVFKSLVESGTIELRVHSLLTGNAYGMIASNTVAETFEKHPELGWDMLFALVREAPTAGSLDNTSDIVASVQEIVARVGASTVGEQEIQNGSFSSWLITVGDDTRLQGSISPPMTYVNDVEIRIPAENLNNPDETRKAILQAL